MNHQFVENKLFPLIRISLGLEQTRLILSEEDIDQLKRFGMSQSILPLIWKGLRMSGYSSEADQSMNTEQMNCLYQFAMQKKALADIKESLEKACISYIPLKGAVLRKLYPEEWMRISLDIDILVHEEDLEHAIRVIEENTDFTGESRHYHDYSMRNSHVQLELHFNIKENMENIDPLLSKVWTYSSKSESGCSYSLSNEFQIFHNIAHMSYHMMHGGLGIRPFIDLWLLRNRLEYDEEEVREMCQSCGLLSFYEKCCELSDIWLNHKPCSSDDLEIEMYCLSGGVFDSGENTMLVMMSGQSKIAYVKNRLFADRKVLEAEYPQLKNKAYMLPVYQIRRWARLINPEKRKKITGELRRVNKTDTSKMEFTEEILRKFGLK